MIDDLDNDGINEIAVGAVSSIGDNLANSEGSIFILWINSNGIVRHYQKISSAFGNFVGPLHDYNYFGSSITMISDLDGDGINEIAVGAYGDSEGFAASSAKGAVFILWLDSDGMVQHEQKISAIRGNFDGYLSDGDYFGTSLVYTPDLGGNHLFVGAYGDDDGGQDAGAVWILFLNNTFEVLTTEVETQTISSTSVQVTETESTSSSVEKTESISENLETSTGSSDGTNTENTNSNEGTDESSGDSSSQNGSYQIGAILFMVVLILIQ